MISLFTYIILSISICHYQFYTFRINTATVWLLLRFNLNILLHWVFIRQFFRVSLDSISKMFWTLDTEACVTLNTGQYCQVNALIRRSRIHPSRKGISGCRPWTRTCCTWIGLPWSLAWWREGRALPWQVVWSARALGQLFCVASTSLMRPWKLKWSVH